MEQHYFFYGNQVEEFERPKVPEIVAKKGIKMSIAGSKYSLRLNSSKTKAVILNVCNKTE